MMMTRIAARLFNAPLLVHPGKAAAILAGIGGRVAGAEVHLTNGIAPLDHRAGTVGDQLGRAYDAHGIKTYDVVNGVAVIPVEGSLVHKGGWLGSESGETSYEGLQTQVLRAVRDPAVRGIAFEVDSCGGEVSGAFETSDMIFSAGQVKPTIAILSDEAYSAGYLMAAACRQVVLPETGGAGSIGVITLHTDMSRALEAAGLTVTILAAGVHKADGNPFQPLPAEVAATIRAELDGVRAMFAGRVAAYRGARLSFDQAIATEARTYAGEAAVEAGLADATGHPSDAFQAFVTAVNRA